MNRYLKNVLTLLAILASQTLLAQISMVPQQLKEKYYASAGAQSVNKSSEGEWKSMGIGKYRDDMLTSMYLVDNYEFDVEIQENLITPGIYRVVSPYKKYPINPAVFEGDTYMEINATDPNSVYFSRYDTGLDWGSGNFTINSMAGDYLVRYGSLDKAKEEGLCGKLEDGIITFPQRSLLIRDNTMGEDQYLIANNFEKFRIVLPNAPKLETVITIKYELIEQDGGYFVAIDVNAGSDVEKYKLAMVEGDFTETMAADIASGAIPSVEKTENGEQLFPYEKDGVYTFIVVPYYEGTARKPAYVTDELTFFNIGWRELGTTQYTDGFLGDSEVPTSFEVVTTTVEIQESTEKPGLFRLVDPYGLNYAYATEQTYDTSHRYYMEIDASDPDRVFINDMPNGCGLYVVGLGRIELWSRAGKYMAEGKYTADEIYEKNLFGKREGNLITFPKDALLLRFFDFLPQSWYWANRTESFKLVIPEGASINRPSVGDIDENAPVEYYTVDGIKVTGKDFKPGLYIKKQGSNSCKIVIR